MKKQVRNAIIIAVVFGAVAAAFGLLSPQVWNSPDETAIAFFSKNMAATGQLFRVEPYNLFQNDTIHPRSIISIDGYLVPGSFYGAIFFFGLFYKLIGPVAFALGTPLATALAGLCVFFVIRRLYDERRALIAEVLFLANPAVWYFASRGLFPNLLFADLAIIGTTILYLQPWQASVKGRGNRFLGAAIDIAVGMFVLGAAFLVRPVEFIWLAPILIAVFWFSRKSVSGFKIAVGAVVAAAFVIVLLYTNSHLYGGLLNFGYTAGSTAPGVSVPALSAPSRLPSFLSAPRPLILPFGLHPRLAITNLWNYVALFAWWLPALAAIGYLLTKDRANRRRFSRVFWWAAIVLGVYYGSGIFTDSSVSQWTIGSSYLRYFLPASILLVPLAAEGVDRLARKKRWIAAAVLVAFAALSIWTVYFRSSESLVPMRATLAHYAEIKTAVLKEVPPGGVIITERSDKIFFPDRKVVMNLRDQATLDELPRLAPNGLYYYGITITESELPAINKELQSRGLQLGRFKTFGNETLYGITKIPNDTPNSSPKQPAK